MGNGNQNKFSFFEKKIIYTACFDNYLMVYVLSDILKNRYAVVMSNFLYQDKEVDLINSENLFNELVLEELKSPFMDWYLSIEEAISQHIREFSQPS